MPAIAGLGAYAPRLRIAAAEVEDALGQFAARGIERTAVPEADEDALTMAHEAAIRALAAADREASDLAHLAFATTTPPLVEEDLTPRLASTLGAPQNAVTRTFAASTRAGAQALAATLDAELSDEDAALVVASDCPRGAPTDAIEHAAGAGAVAAVLEPESLADVVDAASHVEPYPGTRFRGHGEAETTGLGVTEYDREAFRSVLGGAADALSVDPGTADAAAVQSPDGDLPYRAADALGVDADRIAVAQTVEDIGDVGAASPLLGLATAADAGADRVLLAGYGSGAGATLLVVDGAADLPVEAAVEGDVDLEYTEYLRRRGVVAAEEPDGGGAYVSVPSWQRTTPQRHRLVAGRCPDCGALNLPPEGACLDCGDRPDAYEEVELPGRGTVEATTTIGQGGAPPEFVEQQSRSGPYDSAVVALDGPDGGTVSLPLQVVPDAESPAVGDRVDTTVRRIYEQEGVVRYGRKAVPAEHRE